jgi:hypothetical protein
MKFVQVLTPAGEPERSLAEVPQSMNEVEWSECSDAGAMLEYLWSCHNIKPCGIGMRFGGDMRHVDASDSAIARLEGRLHRYYLVSCRAIWKLLPQEESRRGVEVAERYLMGKATAEEFKKANYEAEGAAFNIDYNVDPDAINQWVAEFQAIPKHELQSLLHPPTAKIEARELLKRAAYFVDYAMVYPSLTPKGPPSRDSYVFLSAALLREMLGNPFRGFNA